ncbi:phage baseplate assembly protein domain-containing protein [Pasteurella sp. PK-2025]|uniref:phage baseplate assembly protein domain-containing protein n=1 Tax=Pasteurella sp. PK-2025 TaxID=3413133 RepID=UPI003C73A721
MQGLNRVLAPIKRSLKLLVNRGVMSFVSDEHKRQNLQIRLQSDEVIDDAERFQNYGFSSVPTAGEVIALEVLTCKKLTVRAEQEVLFETPQTRFSGDVDIVGQSTAKDHVSGSVSGKDHDHERSVGKPV